MLRNMKAATSSMLVLVLAVQACMTPMGPPMPINPDDEAQMKVIEEAAEVRVVTVEGRVYQLVQSEVIDDRLRGRESNGSEARTIAVPLDSISSVQAYKVDSGIVVAGVVIGSLVLLAVLSLVANPPTL